MSLQDMLKEVVDEEFNAFKRGLKHIQKDGTDELKKRRLELQIERLRNSGQDRDQGEEENGEELIDDDDEIETEDYDEDYVEEDD